MSEMAAGFSKSVSNADLIKKVAVSLKILLVPSINVALPSRMLQ